MPWFLYNFHEINLTFEKDIYYITIFISLRKLHRCCNTKRKEEEEEQLEHRFTRQFTD